MGRLDGRVVLITGAARGQGEAEARLFVAEGAGVVLGDVLDEAGEAVAKELGDSATYVHLDVRREAEWESAVAVAVDRYGKLDGLINNAGILRFNSIRNTSVEEYMSVVEVNQLGVFLGIKAVSYSLKKAGGGTIVNTSSFNGYQGLAGLASYASTKFAIRGLTRVAALELGPKIRVNAICPGGVRTPMSTLDGAVDPEAGGTPFEKLPSRRIGEPEEVAKLALFLTSDESSYCTGADFVIDGGMLAGPSWG